MRGSVVFLGAGLVVAFVSVATATTTEPFIKVPSEIEFKAPLRPGAPPGAVLYGAVDTPGMYVNRVKFPAGFRVMPHWHARERTVVVLSGTLYVGYGDKWDESKMTPCPPGTFMTEPPKVAHYTWAKDGEVVIQVTGIGPLETTQIPQK
jgi:quercetin dioxygenase-like cupin family protein